MNGVQNGLNNAMNTIKFILVIVLPETQTFGWLIICSFSFVCMGAISYNCYACKNSGKVTPKNKENIYAAADEGS
jgi:iron-regulated transporter 1